MKKISLADLQKIIMSEHSEITHAKPAIIETANGTIVKFFYHRKLISSNRFSPYALRFYRNAKRLAQREVLTVDVVDVFCIAEKQCHVVIYHKLPGADIRELLSQHVNVLPEVAKFLAQLHRKGIFFRSVHLGNLLYFKGAIALLDIADVDFKRDSLGVWHRARNMAHLLNNETDKPALKTFGIEKFLRIYLEHSDLTDKQKKKFTTALLRRLP